MDLKKALAAILVLSVSVSYSQEEFVPPQSAYLTKFPFKMLTGGIITLKAKVGNFADSLNFILDTGSGGISLDSATVHQLGIPSKASDRTIRGIAGIRKVRFAYKHTLHLPGLSIPDLDFHINDYEILSSVYGEKIDGIIGYSLFSKYIILVNYDSMQITVQTKGRIRYPRGGFLLKPFLVNIPVTNVTVKDDEEVSGRFYFDTGAGMCILMSEDFVQDSVFLRTSTRWHDSQAEGLGGKTAMKQGVVKQVKLGPYKFRNVPAYIFEDEYNITAYPYLGGLIGNDLLRRFNLIINYDKKDIHLIPNLSFNDKFDYSYTGLGMYFVNNEIKVLDIMKNSPAEKAGFKPGDIVLAVQNNFSQNIQTYKNLMQTPGSKVLFIVDRQGEPLQLTLKVSNLMN